MVERDREREGGGGIGTIDQQQFRYLKKNIGGIGTCFIQKIYAPSSFKEEGGGGGAYIFWMKQVPVIGGPEKVRLFEKKFFSFTYHRKNSYKKCKWIETKFGVYICIFQRMSLYSWSCFQLKNKNLASYSCSRVPQIEDILIPNCYKKL